MVIEKAESEQLLSSSDQCNCSKGTEVDGGASSAPAGSGDSNNFRNVCLSDDYGQDSYSKRCGYFSDGYSSANESKWRRTSVHHTPAFHHERRQRSEKQLSTSVHRSQKLGEEREDEEEDTKKSKSKGKQSKKFTGRQKLIVVCLCLVNFTSFLSMSIIAPFFPKEAEKKGMRESVSGFVFSVYALALMIMSPIFGKVLPKVGANFMFLNGIFVAGVCNVLFGFLDKLTNLRTFTAFCFIIRIFEAVGAAAFTTASCTYIFSMFPDDIGTIFGIIETSIGIGMSLGPAIGGALYSFGGYGLPFFTLGVLVILNVPISWFLLKNNATGIATDETLPRSSYSQLLSLPRVWLICAILMVGAQTQGFLDPTLEPHLRQYNIGPGLVGLVFLLISAAYGVCSPLVGWIVGRMENKSPVMISGVALMLIALLVLGPAPFLPFKGTVGLCLAAVTVIGVSLAMAFIPTFESILLVAMDGGLGDNIGTYSLVSGLWNGVYSLGEVTGPAAGGVLMDFLGFPWSATIIAALCGIALLVTLPLLCLKPISSLSDSEPNEKSRLLAGTP